MKAFQNPTILDWDTSNPLMQYIRDLSLIRVNNVSIPTPLPAGARALIESDKGPIALSSPRDGFTDVIVCFALTDEKSFNTDWFLKYSFPLFLSNCLQQLAGVGTENATGMHAPGSSFSIPAGGLVGKALQVQALNTIASGSDVTTNVDSSGRAAVTSPGLQGAFTVKQGEQLVDLFAVDLFDNRESDLSTRGLAPLGAPGPVAEKYQMKIGFTPVAGKTKSEGVDAPLWKWAVVAGLMVLVAEWFIYNRRVAI